MSDFEPLPFIRNFFLNTDKYFTAYFPPLSEEQGKYNLFQYGWRAVEAHLEGDEKTAEYWGVKAGAKFGGKVLLPDDIIGALGSWGMAVGAGLLYEDEYKKRMEAKYQEGYPFDGYGGQEVTDVRFGYGTERDDGLPISQKDLRQARRALRRAQDDRGLLGLGGGKVPDDIAAAAAIAMERYNADPDIVAQAAQAYIEPPNHTNATRIQYFESGRA